MNLKNKIFSILIGLLLIGSFNSNAQIGIIPGVIASSMQTDSEPVWVGLDHWWELNESSGTIYDSEGGDTAVVTGAIYDVTASDIISDNNSALFFDSDHPDYAICGTGFNYGDEPFTVTSWIMTTATPPAADGDIVSGTTGAFFFEVNSDGHLSMGNSGTEESDHATTLTELTHGSWHFIGVSWDGDTARFCVDGELEEILDFISTPFTAATDRIGIRSLAGNFFDGLIDELNVWDHEFTTTEWAYLYNEGYGKAYDSGSEPDPPIPPSFNVLKSYDFEDLALDASFEIPELMSYFQIDDYFINEPDYHDPPAIVEDEINSVTTNVIRIIHETGYPVDYYYSGLSNFYWKLDQDYDSIALEFNYKIDTSYCSTEDLKAPGFITYPSPGVDYPLSGDGIRAQSYNSNGSELWSYHYDRTGGVCNVTCDCNEGPTQNCWCPHSNGTADLDSVYLVPGVWYNIRIHAKANTFSGSTPNADGMWQIFVDGKVKNQTNNNRFFEDLSDTMRFDGVGLYSYTGGSGTGNQPTNDFYTYFDNIKIGWPVGDDKFGTTSLYTATETIDLVTPIIDNEFVYDELITSTGTLTNETWGGSNAQSTEETYLLDAGADGTVTIDFNADSRLASANYLFIYDGNNSASSLMSYYNNESISADDTYTSSGRYMFIRYNTATNCSDSYGWSFEITHEIIQDEDFNIVVTKDYTGLSLGAKSNAEMEAYYDTDFYGHSTTDYKDVIVETTINGELDTCLRITNYDDGVPWCPDCDPPTYGVWGTGGSEITISIDTTMEEAFLAYYVKLDEEFRLEGDSKMCGWKPLKECTSDPYPQTEANGWLSRIQIKPAGTFDTYNYDRSDGVEPWLSYPSNPWAYGATTEEDEQPIANYYQGSDYLYNDFITYGSWHLVEMRLKMNTWDGETANRDGVFEVALDKKLVFQMDGMRFHTLELDTNKIQGFSITQFMNVETSGSDFYSYVDNFVVYVPLNDTLLGLEEFHTEMWDSPVSVPTDDYYTDSIIDVDTENVTISSTDSWETYMWTIDAGTDQTVTLSWNSGDVGSGSYVAVFDGKTAGSDLLVKYNDVSDMSAEEDVVSTGQYMYVYLVSGSGGGDDLSGDITFSNDSIYIIGLGGSNSVPVYDSLDNYSDLYVVTNCAVPGAGISDQKTAYNNLPQATKDRADYVFMWLGVNSIASNNTMSTMTSYYTQLIDDINADVDSECKVVTFAMSPWRGSSYWNASRQDTFELLNDWILSLTPEDGVDITSTAHYDDAAGFNDSLRNIYNSGDEIHLNVLGKEQIEQNLVNIINDVPYREVVRYDWATEDVGTWTEAEANFFWGSGVNWRHEYWGTTSIGEDTIGEEYTKILRIRNIADELYHGYSAYPRFPQDSLFDELYCTYMFKFDTTCYVNQGGKLSGFSGWFYNKDSVDDIGGPLHTLNFSENKIFDYNYDNSTIQTHPTNEPWSSLAEGDYLYDSIWPVNGNWYQYTIRVKLNTFSGSSPNSDGVYEAWIDGRKIISFNGLRNYVDLAAYNANKLGVSKFGHFYGGSGVSYTPTRDMYGEYGPMVWYQDTADITWGTTDLHHDDSILSTPLPSAVDTFLYDVYITSEVPSFDGSSYLNTAYDTITDNTYLIYAGEGSTVSFEITTTSWGSSDYLYIYDGNTTDADLLYVQRTSSGDISGTYNSTQPYMFIRVSYGQNDYFPTGAYNLTGVISFDP